MANSRHEPLSAADRRRVDVMRNAIKLSTRLPDPAGDGGDALILNISATGVLLETSRDLQVGEDVRIDLPASGIHHAQVMWTIDGMVGCQFLDPLSKGALGAALLKGDALPAASSDATADEHRSDQSDGGKRLFGMAIAHARKVRGMRQGELAKAIGVSTTTICKWEQGHVTPRAKAHARLEQCLGPLDRDASRAMGQPVAPYEVGRVDPDSVLQDCKLRIAKVLGVSPEAISWQLQVKV